MCSVNLSLLSILLPFFTCVLLLSLVFQLWLDAGLHFSADYIQLALEMQGHCNVAAAVWEKRGFPKFTSIRAYLGPWTDLGAPTSVSWGLVWDGPPPGERMWSLETDKLICNCSCLKFRTKGGLREHLTILQVRKRSEECPREPRAPLFSNVCC